MLNVNKNAIISLMALSIKTVSITIKTCQTTPYDAQYCYAAIYAEFHVH